MASSLFRRTVTVSVAAERQICVHQDKSGYSSNCALRVLSGISVQLHNNPHETLYHLTLSRDYM
jgi:hypothetical protein